MIRAPRVHALVPTWLVLVVCSLALLYGVLGTNAAAQGPAPAASASVAPAASASASAASSSRALPAAPPSANASKASKALGGMAPMPGDVEVPLNWMPPGTSASPLPSDEIFPPQTLTIRFNHKMHVKAQQQSCKVCHAGAYSSDSANDRLMPNPKETCDNCHDVDHSNPKAVKAGKDENGQCSFCHLGANAGVGGQVAPLVMPRANLRFPHKKHLGRNIQCGQCHGQIAELEQATREQLPRMAGCFSCHNMSGASQGDAKGTCTNCHLTQPDGRLKTAFSSGDLRPPRWLHNAGHTADWIERHKTIAADDTAFCGSCHSSNYCTDCHDGKVRPRNVHPNDWLSMHPIAARQDNPRCVSCHQDQTFCADCHRRTGVARDSASGNRLSGRRFHPPPQEWTTAPRGPNHHSWEAIRNLNACVSCHTERDCTTCHATRGLSGGMGVNPHPSNFAAGCRTPLQRNPRPCYVCHQPSDADLGKCK